MNAVGNFRSFVFGVALTIAGGALAADKPIEVKPGTGLAFGQFDFSESEVAVDEVHLVRVKPRKILFYGFGMKPWESGTVTYNDGAFFSPNLKPGTYVVTGFRSGNVQFNLEDAYKNNGFEVASGSVVYAGTYKTRGDNGGLFRRPKGSFERADSPEAEIDLLRWLADELDSSWWSDVVKAHLKQRLQAESGAPKSAALTSSSRNIR